MIFQIERRPGLRFVSEVLEIRGYDPEADRYDLWPVYVVNAARAQESKTWLAAK
jgi:hypothetical protein